MSMNIKCVLDNVVSEQSIQPVEIFSDVSNVRVMDWWEDLDKPTITFGNPDAYCQRIIHLSQGSACSTGRQQQYIRMEFECGGTSYQVFSAMPIFITNSTGKTIEAYHPVRK